MMAKIESLVSYWVKPVGSQMRPLLSESQAANCGAEMVRVRELIDVDVPDLGTIKPDAIVSYRDGDDRQWSEQFFARGEDRHGKAKYLRSTDSFDGDPATLGRLLVASFLYSFDRQDLNAVKRLKSPPASRIVYSTRDSVAARWRERIEDEGLAVAGGLLLRGFGEPTIMLRSRPDGSLEVQAPGTPHTSSDSRGIGIYRLDEWDRLQADVALLDAPAVYWGHVASIDVKAGTLKANAVGDTLSLAARYIVNAIGDRIYTLHAELLDDYVDLYFHCNPRQSHHRDDVHEDVALDPADIFAAASRLSSHVQNDVIARQCLTLIKTAMEASSSPGAERMFDQAPAL